MGHDALLKKYFPEYYDSSGNLMKYRKPSKKVKRELRRLKRKENIFYESNAERNLTKVDNLERDLILEAERY